MFCSKFLGMLFNTLFPTMHICCTLYILLFKMPVFLGQIRTYRSQSWTKAVSLIIWPFGCNPKPMEPVSESYCIFYCYYWHCCEILTLFQNKHEHIVPKVGMVMLMPTEGEVGDLLVLLIFMITVAVFFMDEIYFTSVWSRRGVQRDFLAKWKRTQTTSQSQARLWGEHLTSLLLLTLEHPSKQFLSKLNIVWL